MKFLNFFYFCGSFLPSWIRFQDGSGSETLLLSQFWDTGTVPGIFRGLPVPCIIKKKAAGPWWTGGGPKKMGVRSTRARNGAKPHYCSWKEICRFSPMLYSVFYTVTHQSTVKFCKVNPGMWMRSSRVVRASDCQCRSRNIRSQHPPTQ